MIATCPPHGDLRAFSLGQLDEERSDLLFNHVSDCTECQEAMETLEGNDELVDQLHDSTTADDRRFQQEPECQDAIARALAALAGAATEHGLAGEAIPETIGDYKILRQIGRGGMGVVYLARHTRLGREVAVKLVAGHRVNDPAIRGRFETEMQAAGALSHPNIVSALDAREVDGVGVLVTEWIEGMDLGEIVRRTGPLSSADAVQVARQVAAALQAIDDAGLVHRDIKPSNIMITDDGQVKLLDLGLARLQGDRTNRELTMTGQAIGTADYLAPEQINGSLAVDIRADIYALGCTLFKLLTGEVPYGGDRHATSFAKMTAHVSGDVPRVDSCNVPANLVSLVQRMMAKSPDQRPGTPGQVSDSLNKTPTTGSDLPALVAGATAAEPNQFARSAESPIKSSTQQSAVWWRRRVPALAAIAAGLAGVAIGLALGIIITIKHPDGSETRLEVPDGSQVTIDQQGNAQVDLPTDKQLAHGHGITPPRREPAALPGGGAGERDVEPRPTAGGGAGERDVEPRPTADSRPNLDRGAGASPHQPETEIFASILPGVWELKIIRGDTRVDDEVMPNLMVFGTSGNKAHETNVVVLRYNFPLAEGSYQWLSGNRIHMRFHPPAGTDTTQGTFWMPDEIEGEFDASRSGDRAVISWNNSESMGASTAEPIAKFELRKIPLQGTVLNLAAAALEPANVDRAEAMLTFLKMIVDAAQPGGLPSDDLNQLDSFHAQSRLRTLVIGTHYWHDHKNRLPASRNTVPPIELLGARDSRTDVRAGSNHATPHPYSWRVAILPFIGRTDLYEKYRFDEAWDGDNNRKLIPLMPLVFSSPGDPADGKTRFVGISGPQAGMALDNSDRLSFESMTDGTSRTLLLIESAGRVPWTRPWDFQFDAADPFQPKIEWLLFRGDNTNVAFADGHAESLRMEQLQDGKFQALVTRSGGESDD